MASGHTVGIEEIRPRLKSAGVLHANDNAVDDLVESLRKQYGDNVPAAQAIRFFRENPLPASEITFTATAKPAAKSVSKAPDGVTIESTPAGFLLRAQCGSFIGGAIWAAFVGVLVVIPFRLWGDLIRDIPTYEGLGLWMACAFLLAWTGGIIYAGSLGAMACFGEIRIAKEGDSGEIFSGIGKVGRTHRLRWSEFNGAEDKAVASGTSGRYDRTTHYVGLDGMSSSYTFGSEMNQEQREFVIAYLREHVFAR